MTGGREPRRVAIGGATIRVADDQPTFWDRVEAGQWEPGTLTALDGLLGPGVDFVDLGAWVGPLTLLAAARGARVVAVEADPAALDQLARNLLANPGLAERVTILPKAVSPRPGPVRLGARRKPGDSMSSTLLAGGPVSWTADGVTPAEIARGLGRNGRRVTKVDLEGAEYALLPALAPLLNAPDPVVLLSFHPAILAGSGEPAPRDRQREAVAAAFPDWQAFAVAENGLLARGRAADVSFAPEDGDTWLFRPG